MTEIKVHCPCGQKFKFDVEPVNGQVPFAVNCPTCGTDGTAAANAILAQQPLPAAAPRPAMAAAFARPTPRTAPARGIAPGDVSRAADEAMRAMKTRSWEASKPGELHLGRGVLGAVLGAGLGVLLVFGFALLFHFVFPYSFAGVGALAGLGARIGYRGTRPTLGLLAAVISVAALFLLSSILFGPDRIADVFIRLIISLAVGAWAAYRIAS
jgi:hypothetical protein